MADVITVYEGNPTGTTEVTVATIATGKAFIMQGYEITNKNTAAQTATLKVGTGTQIVPGLSIPAKDGIGKRDMNLPILAGKSIKFTAGVANDMFYYIYGITIDNP